MRKLMLMLYTFHIRLSIISGKYRYVSKSRSLNAWVAFCIDAYSGILRNHNWIFRGTQLRYTRTFLPIAKKHGIGNRLRDRQLSLCLCRYLHSCCSSFFLFVRPVTLFHSRNWLWTRWPIKSATATARTRIKIAAFLEAR